MGYDGFLALTGDENSHSEDFILCDWVRHGAFQFVQFDSRSYIY